MTARQTPPLPERRAEIVALIAEMTALRQELLDVTAAAPPAVLAVHPAFHASAGNFLQYLVLRRHDLRGLQQRLAVLGLSSLGRAEAHVLATVDAVLRALCELAGEDAPPPDDALDFAQGARLLAAHSEALLGPAPPGREVRILVTMPSEAADDYTLVHDLLQRGMDCMRINCAHDGPVAWGRMIAHLRHAEQALGRRCRVLMDLGGPKLRTGPLQPGPAVIKIKPQRDVYGRVIAPARVWLHAADVPTPAAAPMPAEACLPVPGDWLATIAAGERLQFRDARNARRELQVVDVGADGVWAELVQTAYFVPGTVLHRRHDARHRRAGGAVAELPGRDEPLLLFSGDLLLLTQSLEPGRPAVLDSRGRVLRPAQIGCTLGAVFDSLRAGEPIWFDDGKIGGVIERCEPGCLHVRITHARPRGEKLRSDKGINLPESHLQLAALTDKDLEDLQFVVAHADIVGLSFANRAEDVAMLREQMARLTAQPPALVLKIETRRGFENLPQTLLTAMRAQSCGVMIARGDLAVECGFERLAEVQEEMLWLCEAAHVPVIWATQVLESMARDGLPSRAEITDAAMGHRAECVMLNKGPHIVAALGALDDILRRMQAHQSKKSAMLRALHLAQEFAALPALIDADALAALHAQATSAPAGTTGAVSARRSRTGFSASSKTAS